MSYLDLNEVRSLIGKGLYSNTLSENGETFEKHLEAKAEAARWCLAIGDNLQHHTVNAQGILERVKKLAPAYMTSEEVNNLSETDDLTNDYAPGQPNITGFVMMPERGPGWISNPGSPDEQRWGQPKIIQALVAIAKEWQVRGNYLPIVIGDISKPQGGHFPPHVSHRFGIDVDLRPIGYEKGRVTVTSNYNRSKTREFIELIKRNGIATVKAIGFQDSGFVSEGLTLNWKGHKDHLHVRFNP